MLFPSFYTSRRRVEIFTLLFAVFFFSFANSVQATENLQQDKSVIGQWKLTAALDGAEITSLDEKEAQRLVGQVMTISQDRVQLGSRKCSSPEFDAQRVEPRLFLRKQVRARADDLRLPNPVTVVDLSCTFAFVKNPNRLVIFWKGWFFDARRVHW